MTDLPKNLAKPRDPERARLIANLVVGGVLMVGTAALLVWAIVMP